MTVLTNSITGGLSGAGGAFAGAIAYITGGDMGSTVRTCSITGGLSGAGGAFASAIAGPAFGALGQFAGNACVNAAITTANGGSGDEILLASTIGGIGGPVGANIYRPAQSFLLGLGLGLAQNILDNNAQAPVPLQTNGTSGNMYRPYP